MIYEDIVYINITASKNGCKVYSIDNVESCGFAEMLALMYWRFGEKFKPIGVFIKYHEIGGIECCTFKLEGKGIYKRLCNESGTHTLIKKSIFVKESKICTSLVTVFIYPFVDYKIDKSDLKIERSTFSPCGGGWMGKPFVQVTHIPTKLKVECEGNKSQYKNEQEALDCLKSQVYAASIFFKSEFKHIRTYDFFKNIVKDKRTKIECEDVKNVMNGNIDMFLGD